MLWTVSEYLYHRINSTDRYQIPALVSAIAFGLLLGTWLDLDIEASYLCIVPWSIYWSLILSDILHRCVEIAINCVYPAVSVSTVLSNKEERATELHADNGSHGNNGIAATYIQKSDMSLSAV